MEPFVEKTIVVSSPKRSGGTLLTNLFDFQPGIVHFADEAFFWEHVHNFQERGQERLFIDLFRNFEPKALEESLIDRDVLPWIDGIFRGMANKEKFELDLGFNREAFVRGLSGLAGCSTVSQIWDCLVQSYAGASALDYSGCRTAFIFSGDWGRSMLSTKQSLRNCRCIFIMRNPFYALESLKKNRMNWARKPLHPLNLAEVINHYFFFWNNRSAILDDRTLLIRFEDLVADTEKVMRTVAAHAGIDYSDNLTRPTLLGKPWRGESSFTPQAGVDRNAISRKITTLTPTEINLIREHLKPLLNYFDYAL